MSAPRPGKSRLPAVFMLLGSISSIQLGAAIAVQLFDRIGAAGAIFLRAAFATVILWLIWRPSLRIPAERLRLVILFGVSLGAVGLTFFEAIDRIPLGTAVTLEFTGPLTVALVTSRRRQDFLWAGLAAVGIVLLTGGIDSTALDLVGVVMALAAGFFWGAYIVIGTRLGVDSSGGSLLAQAMLIATVITLPAGLLAGGSELLSPTVMALACVVGVLNAALPFSLEFEAMRRLPSNVFGVMMSLEPAIAALVGFVALGQGMSLVQLGAVALVVSASAGVLRSAGKPAPVEA